MLLEPGGEGGGDGGPSSARIPTVGAKQARQGVLSPEGCSLVGKCEPHARHSRCLGQQGGTRPGSRERADSFRTLSIITPAGAKQCAVVQLPPLPAAPSVLRGPGLDAHGTAINMAENKREKTKQFACQHVQIGMYWETCALRRILITMGNTARPTVKLTPGRPAGSCSCSLVRSRQLHWC